MKRRFKFLVSTLALTAILGGITTFNTNALESSSGVKTVVPKSAIQQTVDGYTVDLKKVDLTIDEIREMTMGEYYQTIFPDVWNKFTDEEKDFYSKTPYPKPNEEINNKASVTFRGKTTISRQSGSTPTLKGTMKTNRVQGSAKATEINHSTVLVDDSGGTWAGHLSSNKNSTSYTSTLVKSALKKGKLYRFETVHTISLPKGYNPAKIILNTQSPWSPCV